MTVAPLLEHFDRVSEAPGAVPQLRRFILDLAVRGQLVAQDPSDEPASELVNRIHVSRQLAGARPRSRLLKDSADAIREPLEVPQSWLWVRFAQIAAIQSNLVDPHDYPELPHIAPDNIESRSGRLLSYETVKQAGVTSAKHRFFAGSILYSKIRPALAKAVIVDFDGLCSADMYPILALIHREYLHKYMLSDVFVEQSISEDNRVAMPKINQAALSRVLVAVPPLAEQHRIVAKVDEVMALCDCLEAAQAERESRRDRVVVASLQRLNEPAEPPQFRRDVEWHLGHLSSLLPRAQHVNEFRGTILNSAVRGRLVPQDTANIPASKLLQTINRSVGAQGRGRRVSRALPPVDISDAPFDLPPGWAWARFAELGRLGRGKSPHRPRNDPALFDGGTHPLGMSRAQTARSELTQESTTILDSLRVQNGRKALSA